MEQEIPEGIQKIASLSFRSSNELWVGLKDILNTPARIIIFNHAIEDGLTNAKILGDNDQEAAERAMIYANEIILSLDRCLSSIRKKNNNIRFFKRTIHKPAIIASTRTFSALFDFLRL